MELFFCCTRWGCENESWDAFCKRVKEAGYHGVETGLPLTAKEQEPILNSLNKYGLKLVAGHWETVDADFNKHSETYEKRLEALAAAAPLFINSQTGKDYYTSEQNESLIKTASLVSERTGIPVIHETHRGKFSFAAHVLMPYLQRNKNLHIALDISHWFCVAETFLHDQQEAVDLAVQRTRHIHARVGYTEGPQVSNPQAPEWKEVLETHLAVWDKAIAAQQKNNAAFFTITPEFGAPPYMVQQPFTLEPIASQWEANCFMMQLLKSRYN